MAIVIEGLTICPICGNVHDEGQPLYMFPAIEVDGKAPDGDLGELNDAGVHKECLENRPDLISILLNHGYMAGFIAEHFPELLPQKGKC